MQPRRPAHHFRVTWAGLGPGTLIDWAFHKSSTTIQVWLDDPQGRHWWETAQSATKPSWYGWEPPPVTWEIIPCQ